MDTKEKINVMQAWLDGKKIIVTDSKGNKSEAVSEPVWSWATDTYEVKKNPLRIEEYDGKQCIVVPCLNGKEFYLYPHYKELPLVKENRIKDYEAKPVSLFDALHDYDCYRDTFFLTKVDSPAADYVTDLGFDIPTPAMLSEIMYYREYINELSKTIGGDEIEKDDFIWSCCRGGTYGAWYAVGYNGYFGYGSMCNTSLCVPVLIKES